MKTLEEINEIAPYHPCEWQQGYGIWQSGYMQGQKDGATEQRAIDIDKACKFIEDHASDYVMDLTQEKSLPKDDVETKLVSFCTIDFIHYFRKAMEEE